MSSIRDEVMKEAIVYLHRLIYYSRNAIKAMNKPVAAEVRAILEASKRNNPSAGITGSLLFNGAYFAQILEGDRRAITNTFCRIANDKRHSDIVIMNCRPVTARRFCEWSMAFAGHSETIDPLYVKFGLTVGFNPAKMTAESLLGFVEELHTFEDHVTHAGGDPAAIATARKLMA